MEAQPSYVFHPAPEPAEGEESRFCFCLFLFVIPQRSGGICCCFLSLLLLCLSLVIPTLSVVEVEELRISEGSEPKTIFRDFPQQNRTSSPKPT
jgi:hypothetical protein